MTDRIGFRFVTRFGIGVLNDDWLHRRISLLKATVLPSLQNQSCQDFHWNILVGFDMPEESLERLRSEVAVFPNAKVRQINHLEDGLTPSRELKPFPEEPELLATSRIDDDDLLHRHSVEEMMTALEEEVRAGSDKGIIYHPRGFELGLTDRKVYPLEFHGPSIGLTAFSRSPSFYHAYSFPHTRAFDEKEKGISLREIAESRPSWLYVRHDLGDSSAGGSRHVSKEPALQDISPDFLDFAQYEFGLNVDSFKSILDVQGARQPRVLSKSTLLKERVVVMSDIRAITKKIRGAEGEEKILLQQEYDRLYVIYKEMSNSVFSD